MIDRVPELFMKILDLSDAFDPGKAGTKAASLARLRSDGFPVPDAIVIPVGTSLHGGFDGLASSLERLGCDSLAVRSSATDEDGSRSSAAGRYLSLLGIPADLESTTEAVRRVVASAAGGDIAVLIQPMIAPMFAGAAFSVDPVTGDDLVVVSVVRGLADGLMEGRVSGSEWAVKDGRAQLRSGEEVPEKVVQDAADLAVRVADHLGYPVDIEWAHDGDRLHLLQARPITALPVRPDISYPEGNWQKEVTHHPRPVAPLVASLLDHEDQEGADWAARAGLMLKGLDQVSVGGEIYIRPIPLIGDPDGTSVPPWWAVAIVARIHPAVRARMKAAREFTQSEVFRDPVGIWERSWKLEIENRISDLRSIDLSSLSDEQLQAHITDVFRLQSRGLQMHFDLFVPYVARLHEFIVVCRRLLGWDDSEAMRLLAGNSPASSEPTRAMRDIAEVVRSSPTAMRVLDADGPDLLGRLRSSDPDVDRVLGDWIDRFGLRTLNYDWTSPTIDEQPDTIVAMLRGELHGSTEILDPGSVEAEARARLSDGIAEFDRALTRAREISPIREDNVHPTCLAPGALLRHAFLEVGRRLAARSLVRAPEDVFQLRFDEVTGALAGTRENLGVIVDRRHGERRWVLAHPGPLSLGKPPARPPDLRGLPTEGRVINSALMWAIEAEFSPIRSGEDPDQVQGLPGAPGVHTGTARIVLTEADLARVERGDVVICPITNPSWSVLFGIAGAFVCDAGGPLSHTAILAREYAVPSVLAAGDATRRIIDGTPVTVDGAAGTVVPA